MVGKIDFVKDLFNEKTYNYTKYTMEIKNKRKEDIRIL